MMRTPSLSPSILFILFIFIAIFSIPTGVAQAGTDRFGPMLRDPGRFHPRAEVEGLLKLFRQYLKRCIKKAHKNQMRVKIIGDPSAFPQDIQDSIHELEECSKDYDHMYFQIAMNYGSRDEILRGMTRMIEDVKNGTLAENAFDENGKLTEQCFESYLDTAGIPDPDLLIRTSGEQRLSNYLMWQLAYTEFYFTEVPWPDFHEEELRKAIEQYNNRDRRYGGVKEE